MAVNRAKTLDDDQFTELLDSVMQKVRRPLIERVAFLLSYKSGLRVQEIAGLEWEKNVLDSTGKIKMEEFIVAGAQGRPKKENFPVLWVSSDIGKYGSERTLRMHPMLYESVLKLQEQRDGERFLIPSGYSGVKQNLKSRAHALRVRLNRYYDAMGFEGCTSHSGRRTFITKAARRANFANCSLADVQSMAGHRSLSATERYIDTTPQQADLIGLL